MTARSPAVVAPPIWTVPASESAAVSTNARVAGVPRILTTKVRSDGVSITDSGCTPTATEPVIAFLPILMRLTVPSPRDDTHRNVPNRLRTASSARKMGVDAEVERASRGVDSRDLIADVVRDVHRVAVPRRMQPMCPRQWIAARGRVGHGVAVGVDGRVLRRAHRRRVRRQGDVHLPAVGTRLDMMRQGADVDGVGHQRPEVDDGDLVDRFGRDIGLLCALGDADVVGTGADREPLQWFSRSRVEDRQLAGIAIDHPDGALRPAWT